MVSWGRGRCADGEKNEPLVNSKDGRGILLGRKMRSERNHRLKVKG